MCLLFSLHKGLSVLLIFLRERTLCFITSMYLHCFLCIFISTCILTISCFIRLLGVLTYFCARTFRCIVKLLVGDISKIFMQPVSAMNFTLSTIFFVSHDFFYAVYSFSFTSRKSVISPFISVFIFIPQRVALFS